MILRSAARVQSRPEGVEEVVDRVLGPAGASPVPDQARSAGDQLQSGGAEPLQLLGQHVAVGGPGPGVGLGVLIGEAVLCRSTAGAVVCLAGEEGWSQAGSWKCKSRAWVWGPVWDNL